MQQAHTDLQGQNKQPDEPPRGTPRENAETRQSPAEALGILADTFAAAALNTAAAICAILGPHAPDQIYWLALSTGIITAPWYLTRAFLARRSLHNGTAGATESTAALLITASASLTLHAAISLGAPIPGPSQFPGVDCGRRLLHRRHHNRPPALETQARMTLPKSSR